MREEAPMMEFLHGLLHIRSRRAVRRRIRWYTG
jgi:hypothetical protein